MFYMLLTDFGHDIVIKEITENKYGEDLVRIVGVDFGTSQCIFKEVPKRNHK